MPDIMATEDSPPPVPHDFRLPRFYSSTGLRAIVGMGEPAAREDLRHQFRHEYDTQAGVTGLYVVEEDLLMLDRRSLAHHNQQIHTLLDTLGFTREDRLTVVPFASTSYKGRFRVDMPASAGGAYQAFHRRGLRDAWTRHIEFKTVHQFYACIIALRVTAHPPSTEVDYSIAGLPHDRRDEARFDRLGLTSSTRGRFEAGAAYQRLADAGVRVPDPFIDRSG